jgi:hypothetical protein
MPVLGLKNIFYFFQKRAWLLFAGLWRCRTL